jgi:hypothetical protein
VSRFAHRANVAADAHLSCSGTFPPAAAFCWRSRRGREGRGRALKEAMMHGLIYLIGLIVVIMAILSFFGLR